MVTINLPRLVGSREAARRLVSAAGTGLRGQRVVVNSRELRSATTSFVNELVKVVLRDNGAAQMVVLAGSPDFLSQVHGAAAAQGVEDLVTDAPAGTELLNA